MGYVRCVPSVALSRISLQCSLITGTMPGATITFTETGNGHCHFRSRYRKYYCQVVLFEKTVYVSILLIDNQYTFIKHGTVIKPSN